MVRHKRKTSRGEWSEEIMKKAIQDVLDGKKGYKLASKFYNVPQTTLERKVNLARKNEDQVPNVKVPLGPIATIFSKKEERELVSYLKEMEGRLFGLATNDLRKLAYQLAVADRIFNYDETGVSVVPKSRSKVIAATGKNQVGALTSAERGTTITIEICFNAAGTYMPPLFIWVFLRNFILCLIHMGKI